MLFSRRSLVLCSAIVLVFVLVPCARAETMNLNLKFESVKQSMWGPGAAAKPGTVILDLVPGLFTDGHASSWNESAPSSLWPGKITKNTWFWGDVSFGVDGRASTTGGVTLQGTLNVLDPGSVDVTYPVEPSLTFPDQNDFVAGDIVSVTSSYKRGDDWALTTRSPAGSFKLEGRFHASLDLFASICFISCIETDDDIFRLFPSENLAIDSDVDFAGVSPFIDVATGVPFSKNTTYVGASAVFPEIRCGRAENPLTGCDSYALGALSLKADGTGQFLTGREAGVFATANVHAAAIIKKALENKYKQKYPWIQWIVLEDSKTVLDYATVDWTIVAIDLETLVKAQQDFEFKPDLKVRLQFPRTLEYWRASAPDTHTTADFAEIPVGEKIFIRTPSDSKEPMSIVPTFRLDNEFTAKTTLSLSETLPVRVADLDITLPELTIVPRLAAREAVRTRFSGKSAFPRSVPRPSRTTRPISGSAGKVCMRAPGRSRAGSNSRRSPPAALRSGSSRASSRRPRSRSRSTPRTPSSA